MALGLDRRNTTAGGLGTRLPPAQPTLASVSDTSLVQICTLPTRCLSRGVFCGLAAAQWRIRRHNGVRDCENR